MRLPNPVTVPETVDWPRITGAGAWAGAGAPGELEPPPHAANMAAVQLASNKYDGNLDLFTRVSRGLVDGFNSSVNSFYIALR